MKATLENFRGIADAHIAISPIALITGKNGAGKTSIARAVAAAVSGKPVVWNPSRYAPTHKHQSYDLACKEAERLSRNAPGETFFVLQAFSCPQGRCRTQHTEGR